MKNPLKFVTILAGGIAALAGVGFLYQTLADRRDRKLYPHPGRLVDVNGHHLHLVSQGEGAPVVVFEAGLGGTHLDWIHVLPEIAKLTRVVAYDRAGSGWSDPGLMPRHGIQIAAELHELLRQGDIPGPFILVGHSYGGLLTRLYTGHYPHEVAGLVLVDSSHEDQKARMPRQESLLKRVHAEIGWQWYRLRPVFSRLGILRLCDRLNRGDRSTLPLEVRGISRSLQLRARAYDWVWTEEPAIDSTCAQVRSAKVPGHLRTCILAGGNDFPSNPALERAWLSLQEDLACKLPNAMYQVVQGSGHFIQLEQPQAVINAISHFVAEIRIHPVE